MNDEVISPKVNALSLRTRDVNAFHQDTVRYWKVATAIFGAKYGLLNIREVRHSSTSWCVMVTISNLISLSEEFTLGRGQIELNAVPQKVRSLMKLNWIYLLSHTYISAVNRK